MTIDWQIRFYDSVDSTQDLAFAAAHDSEPEGVVIVAAEQLAGRGRSGNSWVSRPGNIYSSYLLRPDISLQDIGQYSFIVAVALAETMRPYLRAPEKLTLKWPNDLLIEGKKVAGILLETVLSETGHVEALIVGVGVNLVHAPEDRSYLQSHVAVDDITQVPVFLDLFLDQLAQWIDKFNIHGFSPVRERWLQMAAGVGGRLQARLPNITYYGIFCGLDDAGGLQLQLENGDIKIIRSGEVFVN